MKSANKSNSPHIYERSNKHPKGKKVDHPKKITATEIQIKKEDEKKKKFFNQTIKEIRKLVYPHLDKIKQKQFDCLKMKALGAKDEKGQKMPYFELVARKKATQRHIEKRMKLETELGVSLNVGKKGSYFEANKQKKKL